MTYDLAIIGGGPAGVAAGVYASRKRLKTVFLTKDWQGQSAVSEGIENWIGTVKISGIELSNSLEKHLRAYAENIVDIKTGEMCTKVEKSKGESVKGGVQPFDVSTFRLTTNNGSYDARTILITSGSRRRKLEVPGAEEFDNKGLTYCATCDGPLFADQDVAVVGGGNAGFETAAQLLAYCKSVTLFNRTDTFKADPGTVEKVSRHPKIKIITGAIPKQVKGDKFVTSYVYTDAKSGKDIELPVTGIFVEIGSLPNTDFIKDVVKLDEFNRIPVDARTQMTKTEGIWAAGDCTDGLYHQNNIAAGDAVKAIEDIYFHLHAM